MVAVVELRTLSTRNPLNSIPDHVVLHEAQPQDDSDKDDDDWSELVEDFEDAQDYIVDIGAIEEEQSDADIIPRSHTKTVWRRLLHNINSILITLGMTAGLMVGYAQFEQQAWSNRMSAIQTCLAIEQAQESTPNPSFCNDILHHKSSSLAILSAGSKTTEAVHHTTRTEIAGTDRKGRTHPRETLYSKSFGPYRGSTWTVIDAKCNAYLNPTPNDMFYGNEDYCVAWDLVQDVWRKNRDVHDEL